MKYEVQVRWYWHGSDKVAVGPGEIFLGLHEVEAASAEEACRLAAEAETREDPENWGSGRFELWAQCAVGHTLRHPAGHVTPVRKRKIPRPRAK